MRKQSAWIGVIAAAMLVLMAVAPAFGAGEQEPAAEEQITLRFSWWGGETRHNAYLDMLDLFMERNPNIRVEAEFSGWDGYIDRLRTQMAANNQPDVFVAGHEGQWAVLPWSGRADLSELDVDTQEFSSVQLESLTDPDGRLIGIPLNEQVRGGYIINKTLLDELGLEMPSWNWTWDDLAELAQQVYDESDGAVHGVLDESAGITYDSFGRRAWDMSVHGASVTNPDGLTQTAEQLQETYEWWSALRESGGATTAAITVQADDGANSPIVTRDAAMLTIALGSYLRFQSNTADELVLVPFPTGNHPGDEVGTPVSTQISAHTPYPEEAAMLLDFLRNDIDAGMIFQTQSGIPANESFREALIEAGLDAGPAAQFELHNWVSANRDVVGYVPPHPNYSEFSELMWAEEQALAFGQQSVEQTVENILQHARNLGL